MGRTFLIADTHFGDGSIIKYENRPYSSVQAMDQGLIDAWNDVVAKGDLVWHLGDFCVPGREREYLDKLNGDKILIRGNHDTLSNQAYRDAGFTEVYDLPVIVDGFWILSHEPLYVNENMPYANLFGHVHASPLYRDFSSQHYCVSVERIGYGPINYEEIKERVQNAALKRQDDK